MSGVPGLIFKQFGWTVVAAVIASLLVARLVTPMMAAWLVRPDTGKHAPGAWLEQYLRLADWCLRHRFFTMVAGTLFFLGSLMLVPLLPTGFIPAGDEGNISVSVELPPGSGLQSTVATAEEARKVILDLPGIDHIFTTVGSAQATGGDISVGEVRKGTLMVVLAERGHRPKQQAIEVAMRKRLDTVPGARFSIGAGKSRGRSWRSSSRARTRRRSPAPRMPSSTICAGCRTWAASSRPRASSGPRSPCARTSRARPSAASRRRRSATPCASQRAAISRRASQS
jgi:multidrug efflux pump subunit AcrB